MGGFEFNELMRGIPSLMEISRSLDVDETGGIVGTASRPCTGLLLVLSMILPGEPCHDRSRPSSRLKLDSLAPALTTVPKGQKRYNFPGEWIRNNKQMISYTNPGRTWVRSMPSM
jgi:hypothetical protein